MKIPRIISLAGWKGHGKNTAADYLTKQYGYQQIAFADSLREKCALFLCKPETVPADMPVAIQEVISECRALYLSEVGRTSVDEVYDWYRIKCFVHNKPTPDCVRKMLQFVGTEYYRAKDKKYWIKSIHIDPDQHYVFTDRRFFDEDELCLAYGSLMLTVHKFVGGVMQTSEDAHASEKDIPWLYIDQDVSNEWGNVESMFSQLRVIVEDESRHRGVVMMDWEGA